MGDVRTVREAVTSALSALSGWRRSRWAPELFGSEPDRDMHHVFSVAITATDPRDGRQSLTDGMLVVSTVVVTWAHRLRGDNQNGAYDDFLDAEVDLVQAVVGIASQHILVQSLSRKAGPEGWLVGTSTFQAWHRYALS